MKAPRRKTIRLQEYNYSLPGYYFVTICTRNRKSWFGHIIDGHVCLSATGQYAHRCWVQIPDHYPETGLDEFIIMPNHLHGVLIINGPPCAGAQNSVPLQQVNQFQNIIPRSLGAIIRGFKIGVSKLCRQHGLMDFQWQRSFYDHVIRTEQSLAAIREYIKDNPRKWEEDEYHPANR